MLELSNRANVMSVFKTEKLGYHYNSVLVAMISITYPICPASCGVTPQLKALQYTNIDDAAPVEKHGPHA
jgi:hypothetical protein